MHEEEGLYYLCSENKGVDHLRSSSNCAADLRLCFCICNNQVFSSHEPMDHRLSLNDKSRAGVRPLVRLFTHLNTNISANRGPIANKFYLKYHWVEEKATLGFGSDRIRTVISKPNSMATDIFHRVKIQKILSTLLDRIFFILPGTCVIRKS